MILRIKNFSAEPALEAEDRHRIEILLTGFLAALEFTVVVFIGVAFITGDLNPPTLALNLITGALVVGLYVLLRRGGRLIVAWVLPSLLIAANTQALYLDGSIRATGLIGYPFILILVALTLGEGGLAVFGGLTTLAILVLYTAEFNHYIQPDFSSHAEVTDLTVALLCIAVTVLTLRMAVQQITAGLQRARKHALELDMLNANLEQKVKDRTLELDLLNQRLQQELLERKRAEQAQLASESNLKEAQRIAKLGNFEFHPQTQELFWSEEVYRIFEMDTGTPATFDDYRRAMSAVEFQRILAAVEKSMETGETYKLEHELILPDGRKKYLFALGRPIANAQGQGFYIFGTVQDITERKLAEQALVRSELFLNATNQIARTGGWELDIRTNSVYWTDTIKEIHEVPPDYVPSLEEAVNFYAPEYIPVVQAAVEGSIAGQPFDTELQIITAKQNRLWVRAIGRPVFENGKVIKLQGVFQDIHARKLADEALRLSEARYRLLAKNLPNSAVMLFDWDLRFILADGPELENTGYSRAMLEGKKLYEAIPREFAQAVEPNMRRALQGEAFKAILPYENNFYEYSYVPLKDDEGSIPLALILAVNVTERKRLEENLWNNEERLQQVVRTNNIGIFDHDHLAGTLYWSPELRAHYDWGADEPAVLAGFLSRTHAADREQIRLAIQRSHDPAGDGLFDIEHRMITSQGEVRWLSTRSQTFFGDVTGVRRPVQTIGAVVDITEAKIAEEEISKALQEKETLLREIHHRVKNNLQIVSSLLYLQSSQMDDSNLQNMLRESRDRVASMALVHEKLYQSAGLAQIVFIEYAQDLANSLFQNYGVSQSQVAMVVQGEHVPVSIDSAVPCGLILNEVISNSLKYAFPDARQGTVRITLDFEPGDTFKLTIADDGVGLPVNFQERSANSLGMKLIERLAEQIQAQVERTSSEQGTRYAITFPRGITA